MQYLRSASFALSLLFPIIALAAPLKQAVAVNDLICSDQKVLIQTTCQEKEPDLPYCPVQSVTFSDVKQSQAFTFKHAFNSGNQPFIVGAECHVRNGAAFVLLRNTNFGNCQICEWTDIFSANGRYLGSTEGMFGGESFKRNQVRDKSLIDLLMTEKYKKSETEFIGRAVSK